jgi:hypothetical protein
MVVQRKTSNQINKRLVKELKLRAMDFNYCKDPSTLLLLV